MKTLQSASARLLTILFAAAGATAALAACSSTRSDQPTSVRPSGRAGNAASSSNGNSGVVAGGNGSGGDGPVLAVDPPGTRDPDASMECARLNIGILGNPGSNGSSDFEQWLTKAGTSVMRIQTTPDEPMTSATLSPFDAVVLDRLTRDYTADEATSFGAWVSAGGGVAAMSGYQDDTTVDWRANSLLAPLGVAFSGDRVWGPATSFAKHPVTEGLTSVTFTGGYSVTDLGIASGTREAIAFLPTTPLKPVGFAVQLGSGRAFAWGDEWIEFDSEWSAFPQIPQLWIQVFAWIAPATKCALNPPK